MKKLNSIHPFTCLVFQNVNLDVFKNKTNNYKILSVVISVGTNSIFGHRPNTECSVKLFRLINAQQEYIALSGTLQSMISTNTSYMTVKYFFLFLPRFQVFGRMVIECS